MVKETLISTNVCGQERKGLASPAHEQVRAGHAVYSRRVLALYDWFVLGFSNRFVWKCPTPRLLAIYNRYITGNHIEVGVGTGYFLDRCRFPVKRPRLVLLDMNANSLAATAQRVSRYKPQVVQANALEPFPVGDELFDSAGINFVLHCLPGSLRSKSCVLDHLAVVLKPGGVVFGSTMLSRGVEVGFLARQLSRLYNARGIFCNLEDSLADLREVLQARFPQFTLHTVGCIALFAAFK
jgi:ubiquinone/menaquinone biosynthesis C-methylase UbiE